ncbi:MAG: VOC family protein [Pseudomonadota bacterium]
MANILRQGHGLQLDHVGISVPDTESGIAQFESLTGAPVALDPPEPDQWYWSGTVPLAKDSFLEIVGPNPTNEIDHPMRPYVSQLKKPAVTFWYAAVRDIDKLAQDAEVAGGSVMFKTLVNEEDDPARSRFTFGALGPDFVLQKPSLIQWERQIQRTGFNDMEVVCKVLALELFHVNAEVINPVLAQLGFDIRIHEGDSRFRLVLDTPNGEVVFDNPGVPGL